MCMRICVCVCVYDTYTRMFTCVQYIRKQRYREQRYKLYMVYIFIYAYTYTYTHTHTRINSRTHIRKCIHAFIYANFTCVQYITKQRYRKQRYKLHPYTYTHALQSLYAGDALGNWTPTRDINCILKMYLRM